MQDIVLNRQQTVNALEKFSFSHEVTNEFSATADIASIAMCSSVYETVLRLSHYSSVWPVCCCGLDRHVISINCCAACLQQAWPPFYPHPQQQGGQQQMRAVSSFQLP